MFYLYFINFPCSQVLSISQITLALELPQITREKIIENANAYLNEEWTCYPHHAEAYYNYLKCPEEGKAITGVPYNYSGSDTIELFQEKITEKMPAGNVLRPDGNTLLATGYTKQFPGIDCSAFITRIWEVNLCNTPKYYKLTTQFFKEHEKFVVEEEKLPQNIVDELKKKDELEEFPFDNEKYYNSDEYSKKLSENIQDLKPNHIDLILKHAFYPEGVNCATSRFATRDKLSTALENWNDLKEGDILVSTNVQVGFKRHVVLFRRYIDCEAEKAKCEYILKEERKKMDSMKAIENVSETQFVEVYSNPKLVVTYS